MYIKGFTVATYFNSMDKGLLSMQKLITADKIEKIKGYKPLCSYITKMTLDQNNNRPCQKKSYDKLQRLYIIFMDNFYFYIDNL